jgi:hypothetical protein
MLRLVTLSTLVAAATAFDFLTIGDWGTSSAKTIAKNMGTYDPEFIFGIGDNFYSSGVKSVDDPQVVLARAFAGHLANAQRAC